MMVGLTFERSPKLLRAGNAGSVFIVVTLGVNTYGTSGVSLRCQVPMCPLKGVALLAPRVPEGAFGTFGTSGTSTL